MRAKWLVLSVAILAVAALSGCGSNGGSGGSEVSSDTDAVTEVGIVNCAQCHVVQNADWLVGRHANIEDDATHGTSPSPSSVHGEGSSCQPCHNSTLDALNMPEAYGVGARDIISCEACHGAGSAHRGVGPIPNPKPGVDGCLQCHAEYDELTGEYAPLRSRSGHSPAATTVVGYLNSGHADPPRDRSTRSDTVGCNRCHSDEGAKLYGHLDNVDAITDADGRGRGAMPLGIENLTSIQCRTCHDSHDVGGTKLLRDASADASAQYNTCNHCHAGNNEDLTFHINHEDDETGLLDREILDTHYDDPATPLLLEGYVIRKAEDTACADCHDVHSGDVTINHQWGNSAHAGRILEVKKAAYEAAVAAGLNEEQIGDAVRNAVAGSATAVAWVDYPWAKTYDGATPRTGRGDCQRCHTATGAMNFMMDPDNYDFANNDFSHLADWTPETGSPQAELLYCWACHDNVSAGTLRNPGPITEVYEEPAGRNPVQVAYPDSSSSNVCLSCHIGRKIGEVIKTKSGFDNLSFVNSHYLAAGGSVFAESGYTFGNRNYSIPAGDTHVLIGTGMTGVAGVDAYTAGPCVTCHFSSNDGSHLLSPFTEYAPGDLALNPVCVNCHTSRGAGSNAANAWLGTNFTTDDLEAGVVAPHKGRYLAALKALEELLEHDGFYFQPSYPYFFSEANSTERNKGVTDWTAGGTDADGMNNMGAAFNFNLLEHDPGGVAHNRRYTRRLIYDAIDWMDDKQLNYSVSATLDALADTTPHKTSAISYLIAGGEPGTAGERY